MRMAAKYHVPSRGQTGNNNIWRIYKNIDKGHTETEYVEHFEIVGCPSWTGEDRYNIGYSLIFEGELEIYTDEKTGLRYARVYNPDKKM